MIKINFTKLSKFERGTFRIWIILSSLWLLYLLLFALAEGKYFFKICRNIPAECTFDWNNFFLIIFYAVIPILIIILWFLLKAAFIWIKEGYK